MYKLFLTETIPPPLLTLLLRGFWGVSSELEPFTSLILVI
jgi:hypothetical protein